MWLPALLFFASAASPQEQPRTFRVPFHTVNGMVLPEASLLLDTGANNSIISPQAAGLTTVQLRALQPTQVGTGAEGDSIAREVDLRLDRRHWMNRRALVMDLSDASKRMGAQVDGFLAQDILREFSPVRIDFKNHAIEFQE